MISLKFCSFQKDLTNRNSTDSFKAIATMFDIPLNSLLSEWTILSRYSNSDFSDHPWLSNFTKTTKSILFPLFYLIIKSIILLPVGTATVERSFSTMNRILCNKRNRLTSDHLKHLMIISLEGLEIPDARDFSESECERFSSFLDECQIQWRQKARRTE